MSWNTTWDEPFKSALEKDPATNIPKLWAEVNATRGWPLPSELALLFLHRANPITRELVDFCLKSDMNSWDVLTLEIKHCDASGLARVGEMLDSEFFYMHQLLPAERWRSYREVGLITGHESWLFNMLVKKAADEPGALGDDDDAYLLTAEIPDLPEELFGMLFNLALGKTGLEPKDELLAELYKSQPGRVQGGLVRERLHQTRSARGVLALSQVLPFDTDVQARLLEVLKWPIQKPFGGLDNVKLAFIFGQFLEKAESNNRAEALVSVCQWVNLPETLLDRILKEPLPTLARAKLLAHQDKTVRIATIKSLPKIKI